MNARSSEARALEPIETASRDEIEALQLQRLRWTVQHAYDNVPHYRQAFDAKGVHPSDLRELKDIAKFPFTVKKDLRAKNASELVALAKAAPGKLSYGSGGAGTQMHLVGELFKQQANVDVVHVPYKGAAPALQDVLAGRPTEIDAITGVLLSMADAAGIDVPKHRAVHTLVKTVTGARSDSV